MFWAVIKHISFEHDIQKFVFTPDYLCRMLAVHYMKHKLFYAVRKSLFAYGLPAVEGEGERPGPFTIKEYFQYIIKKKSWGDVTCLILIASMWSCRISVVNSTTLGEIRVHHNMELGITDIALVFNSSEKEGHFSSLMRCNKELLKGGKVGNCPGYSVKEDIKQRLLQGKYGGRELMVNFDLKFVIISESRLKKILEGRKALGSIKEVINKLEEDGGVLEGVSVPEKEKAKAKQPVHEEADIQEYNKKGTLTPSKTPPSSSNLLMGQLMKLCQQHLSCLRRCFCFSSYQVN